MAPRLPTPCASMAKTVLRPFSTTSAAALPPREVHPVGHTGRLSNLNNHTRPARAHGAATQQRSEAASRLLEKYRERATTWVRDKTDQVDFLRNQKISQDYLRQMPRRWHAGDVYSPHDLSPVEMQKWRQKTLRNNDVVDALGISPLDMYKNFSLIEHFTTPSGMILHSQNTRLRPVNQRKIAKMIRRVQGMGIYPSVHAHPEMLRDKFYSNHR